jgi:hypothetical protein
MPDDKRMDFLNQFVSPQKIEELIYDRQTFNKIYEALAIVKNKKDFLEGYLSPDHLRRIPINSLDWPEGLGAHGEESVPDSNFTQIDTSIGTVTELYDRLVTIPDQKAQEQLIDQLSSLKLKHLFPMKNISTLINQINEFKDKAVRKPLYLALTRAYKIQREDYGAYTSCWGRFFGFPKTAKLQGADQLEKSIRGDPSQNINSAELTTGRLGKIASAYKNSMGR